MKRHIPKRSDASDTRISDLMFEAGQRKAWSDYYKTKGKSTLAEIQLKKHRQAVKALKTLGYDYKAI